MSDFIRHECGIALIRLLKPLEYYHEKYGSAIYGLDKLYLLMEKQHNRGQDGAGVGVIKLDTEPGRRFIHRERSMAPQAIKDIFDSFWRQLNEVKSKNPTAFSDPAWLKEKLPFVGEVLLGHLRYGTHSDYTIDNVHPFVRLNNWRTRNLMLAGNFNMTNNDELFKQLVELGQHPKEKADTVTVLEKIGHFLDTENQRIFDKYKGQHTNHEVSDIIAEQLDVQAILSRSAKDFDGGYAMVGLIGHGDAFVLRDPNGIRPAWWYADEEVVVAASERPAIQTVFNVKVEALREVPPGHALVVKKNGEFFEAKCIEPRERRSCSFERIYFSRGTDKDIYNERKQLGYLLTPKVLAAVNYDLENTVFSFVPNTAEVAFYGLLKGIEEWMVIHKKEQIAKGNLSPDELDRLLNLRPRVEKVAVKDVKLRTFITEDKGRNELVSHVYDITYGSVRPGTDTLVVIDDSIVRGTTLTHSIIANLERLEPKRIVIVSSAPQIRYPDCYGIDMSKLGEFVAFRAAVDLARERGHGDLLDDILEACEERPDLFSGAQNHVKRLYDLFTDEELSERIAQLVRPRSMKSELQIVYQTIENLHKACPNHKGDWYFSGNYPTPGGHHVVNRAFVNYMRKRSVRAY